MTEIIPIKQLEELINNAEDAWTEIIETINNSFIKTEILSTTLDQGIQSLFEIQVTTRSYLGSIAYHCGGLVVNNGWLRILGAGNTQIPSVARINNLHLVNTEEFTPTYYVIFAYDVIGGVFAIDGGGIGIAQGNVCYLSPDSYEWMDLGMGHSDFIFWALGGHGKNKYGINDFYEGFRWNNWIEETENLPLDKAFYIFPPLSTAEGQNMETNKRFPVPVNEIFSDNFLSTHKK